jgi:hypothetical protein
MKQLTIFRILTFVLLPVSALFAFMDLLVLLAALANPGILLIAFILTSFVIYCFCSLKFLTKHIDIERPAKASLRDWIRVNAFVSLFMGSMFVLNALSIFFSSDASLREYLTHFLETQPNVPSMLNPELFLTIMKAVAYFMIFVGVVLVVHIQLHFRILKKFGYLFESPGEG